MTEELEKEAKENSFRYTLDKPWACEVEKKQIMAHFEKGYLAGAEPRKKRIAELEAQIEKMKKYGKLLQDICVVLGNDNHMVAVQLEIVVEKLWDASEEKEGLKMVEDIKNRLLKIKPQDWAEISEWR